jgi:hypothetical protein
MTTTDTTIGINGMAHVILTVSQFAAGRAFYGRLLPALGMTPVCDTKSCSTALALGQRSASSQPVLGMTATVSGKAGWACTTFACVPGRAKTWIACMTASTDWGHHSPSPARGNMGARLLFGAVRGPRWHSP